MGNHAQRHDGLGADAAAAIMLSATLYWAFSQVF
jgi:hypothetical protein